MHQKPELLNKTNVEWVEKNPADAAQKMDEMAEALNTATYEWELRNEAIVILALKFNVAGEAIDNLLDSLRLPLADRIQSILAIGG